MIVCPLDPDVDVWAIRPGEIEGVDFKGTHALVVFGEDVERPMILIDASILDQEWFTQAHLLVILAHEVAHIHNESVSEEMADLVGMLLLYRYGHDEALALHIAEYRVRWEQGLYDDVAA